MLPKKYAKYGLLKNQYLIPDFKSTELSYYLKVKSIPRYVIFNERNELVVEDGPRPTDSIRFKQVLKELLLKEANRKPQNKYLRLFWGFQIKQKI